MGKKHRRNNRKNSKGDEDFEDYDAETQNDSKADQVDNNDNDNDNDNDDDDDDDDDNNNNNYNNSNNNKSFKDCKTFKEKQDWKRKQAADKRKAKQRCYLCGKGGHVRRECPGIADDGRGMSRFKSKSDPKGEKMKREQEKALAQQKRDAKSEDRVAEADYFDLVDFPQGFSHPPEEEEEDGDDEEADHRAEVDASPSSSVPIPHPFFDPHCRVLESIDYIQTQRDAKKKKSSKKKKNDRGNDPHTGGDEAAASSSIREYRSIWNRAVQTTGVAGMIVPTVVQMHKPWENPIPWLTGSGDNNDDEVGDDDDDDDGGGGGGGGDDTGGGNANADADEKANGESSSCPTTEEDGEAAHHQPEPRIIPILFALGLASSVPCTTEAEQVEAKQLLLQTIHTANNNKGNNNNNKGNNNNHQESTATHHQGTAIVAALWVVLDYTKPKRTHEAQKNRLKLLLKVAQETKLTLQVQVLPGIPSSAISDPSASVAGTDYAQALLDFQGALANHLEQHLEQHLEEQQKKDDDGDDDSSSLLQIHLVGWQGRSDHTLSLLKAFAPPACHLYIGLDPTVTFSKATHLHELAFEVPVTQLILETSQIIPSYITKRLGRQAAPHAAWWPFVAEAVARHTNKQRYDMAKVTQMVTENIQRLYPALGSLKGGGD
ncbi:MAG: hypothetical protein SGBAC_007980 [Bacillariaceae sp.]